eukprot:gnl/MRDRNA2_/MRDRNA2_93034_c0_seq1.p1 gnl/MRDRNA2_/MRDRNA2_93034_c0~~gnl/MRDRNA2_/MRDRNA2_93034_c0_seq1.p1  ORF type:complete len:250 (-),score=79.30 gnl/MRDRNA2_/MRDRNA2_93034_c0_seq1:39-788(-)
MWGGNADMQAMMKMFMQMGGGKGGGGGKKQVMKKQKVAVVNQTKPEKIKGTEIKQVKGGGYVRVITADNKEFPPEATKAVYKYLRSIGQDPTPPQAQSANSTQVQGVKKKVKQQQNQEPKVRTPEEEEARKNKAIEFADRALATENRVIVNQNYIKGEFFKCEEMWAWVKPDNPSAIPKQVTAKLKTMCDAIRAKKGRANFLKNSTDNVVFVRVADVSDPALEMKPGVKCKFKLYTDSKGVGGCEVMAA